MLRKNEKHTGFSLIEVLVSVVVMSFGLLSLAALQGSLMKAGAESRSQSVALSMATEKLEFFSGYGDRDEFQALTDGSDDPVTVDGVAFTRSWTVDRYAYPEAGGDFVKVADTGETPDTYVSNNEFKRIEVQVRWNDATGVEQLVALEGALPALSPLDSAKVAKVSSTGGARGPEVIIVNPASEEGVIPIAVGDGTDTAATNPRPEVAGKNNSQRVIETRFDVLTYAALSGDTAIAQSRVETVVAGCTCSTANKPSTNESALRPTYWNGVRYVVPEYASYAPPAGVASGVENQSALCTQCCQDHHDPTGVDGAKFDPRRTTHTHDYFETSSGKLLAGGLNGQYSEACRLIRVDGIFRVAADMYNDYLNLLETDNDPDTETLSDYVPTDAATKAYQKFVLDYLDVKFVDGGQSTYNTVLPPEGTVVAGLINDDGLDDGDDINEPHVPIEIDRADDGTSTLKWLHARGLYIDYLEDAAVQAINEAKLDCPAGADGVLSSLEERTCVLKVLPFTTINLTELADWSTEDATQIVTSNNDFRTSQSSDVPVRGKVVPGTKPTHSDDTDAIARMRLSNSGLAVLRGEIDADDSTSQLDTQAFLPSAKWDCTTDYCTGVNAGGTFGIQLESYAFTNDYPTFLVSPNATCNPATTGNTQPNPFKCTSQKTGVMQVVTVGHYNYQVNIDVHETVECVGAGANIFRKLKYTSKACRNFEVTGASLVRAGSPDQLVTGTFVVANEGAIEETTKINFPVVEPDDVLHIEFGPYSQTTQPYTCTYDDDGKNANDFHVEVPDCALTLP